MHGQSWVMNRQEEAMNPQGVWCPNLDCPARGQTGHGNIGVHSRKERRYHCRVCGKTFGARTGTLFHRRRTDAALIALVITLVSWGCPLVALEHAFGLQPQTVRDWLEAAGRHAEAVHQAQVVQPRDLGQVQADEVRVKTQCGIVWLAMAMMVSTRLWLGGVISTQRDRALITRLAHLLAACALVAPLLLVVDGFTSAVEAFRRAFRTRAHHGGRGAPRKVPWPDLSIGQVVKQYVGKRVVGVTRRLVQGSSATAVRLLAQTPGCRVLTTAYIERLNGTFRARLASLARRTHHLVQRKELLHAGMYLVGMLYTFCTVHASLTLASGEQRTPALAAGITDHCWSVQEVLWHRVPPPRWSPPKRRGRRSKAMQQLIERWAPA
jgi:transposase-like protein